ncbi:hypothetical protein [Pedobacter psychrodurus]|jgi:hypothetical protein|uniref:hypothetical protein n=1 Tax=Pedobacter psychrodurus TaxID=2530456 RepID=UPI00292E63CA|nr:hypothetical protein [Pedobacter psychrodurus]
MKKITLVLLMGIALVACKKNKSTSDCGNKMCTEEFVMTGIKFADKNGAGAEIKDLSVINQRTGEKLYAKSSASISTVKGYYVVLDDANKLQLSEQGDDLKITGTSITTNQTKSAIVKVSGGKCACHISRISGAEQITFD